MKEKDQSDPWLTKWWKVIESDKMWFKSIFFSWFWKCTNRLYFTNPVQMDCYNIILTYITWSSLPYPQESLPLSLVPKFPIEVEDLNVRKIRVTEDVEMPDDWPWLRGGKYDLKTCDSKSQWSWLAIAIQLWQY